MPSPYGYGRSASMYYQYGGVPRHYEYDWTGMPPEGVRAAETRSLGADYFDIAAAARFHKDLGSYPVAMSMESGRRSILRGGPEQTHLNDEAPPKQLGDFLGLSRNEKRFLVIAALAGGAFYLWKYFRGKK